MFKIIEESVFKLESLFIEIRRYLHQNPELSGHEFNTANYINNKLKEAGLESEIIDTIAGPAVIGYIRSEKNTKTIALRADMDALPLEEKCNKPYCSRNPGVMHACGHDFNVTAVLGTAITLAKFKQNLEVNIKFIFQPSEETTNSGALALTQAGIMNDVDSIWTVHALPDLPAGKVGIKYGAITAAVDCFKIIVKGKGGHSARPHRTVDSIFIASQILNSLYSSISRKFDPTSPVVFSVGKIHGGAAPNIISENCEMEGTVRTLDPEIRKIIPDFIKEIAINIALSYGATIDISWHSGPPSVVNDTNLAKLTEESAKNIIGKENIEIITKPSLGAEDFSRYLSYAPGMLVRIGTGGDNCSYSLHSCNFDVNDRAIPTAVKLLSTIAIKYKEYNSKINGDKVDFASK